MTKNRLPILLLALAVLAGCSVQQPPVTPTAVVAPAALPAVVRSPVPNTPPVQQECIDPTSYPVRPAGVDSPTLDNIRRRGYLLVGVSLTAYGLSYRNPVNGDMSGFEVDIVNAIATALFGSATNKTVHWVSMDPTDWTATLTKKQPKDHQVTFVDLVFGAMTMLCDREKNREFSTEYLAPAQRMLVRNSSPITSMADVGGRKVCSSNETTNMAELTGGSFPQRPVVVGVKDETDCMLLLQQGKVDAVFTDDVILAELAAQDRTVKLLPVDSVLNLPVEPAAIGIPKSADHGMTGFVNGVLAQFRGDGQTDRSTTAWEKSYNTWLLADLGPEQPPTPAYKSP
jgi:polar amino acid transport system substrate-binding protein